MPLFFLGFAPEPGILYADAAAAIPGALLARHEFAAAGAALDHLAGRFAPRGAIPVSQENHAPDPIASLWFIRAAHCFIRASAKDALVARLLPVAKQIVQDFITGRGMGGVTMDDGGLLLTAPHQPATEGLRLNALWYSALKSLARDLDRAGVDGADHFDRLAGRFRRSFLKAYWCEGHNWICPPYRRSPVSHGELPDVEQLLLTILPASPMPMTKQRQMLDLIRRRSIAEPGGSRTGLLVDHPTLGRVESLLHRAWLGVGIAQTTESRSAALADAREVLMPLRPLLERHGPAGMPAYYKDGEPVEGLGPDLLTNAEVFAALRMTMMV